MIEVIIATNKRLTGGEYLVCQLVEGAVICDKRHFYSKSLKHTSLAQNGMSHLAEGMVVSVFRSLIVSLGFLCTMQKLSCFFTLERWDSFNCCCHFLVLFSKSGAKIVISSENYKHSSRFFIFCAKL